MTELTEEAVVFDRTSSRLHFEETADYDIRDRQLSRYQKWGFGLWAVILKENEEMIGQCGLTMQPWKNEEVLEIGYLFRRRYWHQGYATEAARACKHYRGVDMPHDLYVVTIR